MVLDTNDLFEKSFKDFVNKLLNEYNGNQN